MYPGLGLGLGLQLLLLLLLLPLLLLACAMVKTPASDFSAEISAKWALWPLPGPGLANRGRSAARSSAEQKLLPSNEIFRTCYCPCPQSSVAVAVSLSCSLLAALGTLAARATHGGFNRVSLQFYYGQHCRTTALRFGLVV